MMWVELSSDPDAVYDEEYTVDLSALEPLAAMPAHAGQCQAGR